jgi:hypothetical protein
LIFLFFHLYFLPVAFFKRAASSFNIVKLLLTLSQVIWPTFTVNCTQQNIVHIEGTHLARNRHSFDGFEECLAKVFTVVCIIEPRETN